MTVGNINADYRYYDNQVLSSNNNYRSNIGPSQIYTTNTVDASDSYVSNSEGCTDGKDDGKIGFFGAIGNAIKGVGKTIVNGVKGMFTNKEGKFSLGKTLLTVGMAAACIAFPAVGVAACVVGGVMGAGQIVKGAVNAANATTDAEAKQAWQDMGGGAFTVAASVVGAKAGVKAVKSTSNAAKGLASLDDAATMGQKAAAFGRDMLSSTKNQGVKLYNKATPYYNAGKIKLAEAKANKITAKQTADYSPKQQAVLDNAKNLRANATDDTLSALDKFDDFTNTAKAYKDAAKIKSAESKVAKFKDKSRLDYTKEEIQMHKDLINAKKNASKKTLDAYDNIKDFSNDVSNYKTVLDKQYAKVKYSAKHPVETAKSAWAKAKNIDTSSIKANFHKLTDGAKNAWTEISTGKYSYQEACNKFGFESVAEIVKYTGGEIFATESV